MELAVAVPMVMMAPVSAGWERRVCVRNKAQAIPANAPGRAVMMMNGIEPGLKVDDNQQIDQHDRGGQSGRSTRNSASCISEA